MRKVERLARTSDRLVVAIVLLLALIALVSLIEYGPITVAIAEPN